MCREHVGYLILAAEKLVIDIDDSRSRKTENSINTLGGIRPAVQDFESITIPIANVRNDLIQLLLQLRESAAKREEEEI